MVQRLLLSALAGTSGPTGQPTREVAWEGQRYRLDLAASEEQRLRRIRDKRVIAESRGYGRPQVALVGTAGHARAAGVDELGLRAVRARIRRDRDRHHQQQERRHQATNLPFR